MRIHQVRHRYVNVSDKKAHLWLESLIIDYEEYEAGNIDIIEFVESIYNLLDEIENLEVRNKAQKRLANKSKKL